MMNFSTLTKLLLAGTIAAALLPASASAADRAALERDARSALQKLTNTVPAAKSLSASAAAVLVFPKVTKAGLGVGDDADPRYLKSAVGLVWRVVMFWLFMIAVISLAWWV